MTADGFPDSWDEVCLVGITVNGGSAVQFAAIIKDITDMTWTEKDIETRPSVSGGHVVRHVPTTTEEITMEIWPVDADLAGDGMIQLFHPQTADDTTDPVNVLNTRTRKKHLLTFLWATQYPTNAGDETPANAAGYRIEIANAYLTQFKPNFNDKEMMAEVKFKWAPFRKDGVSNKIEASTDGSAVIPASSATATDVTA